MPGREKHTISSSDNGWARGEFLPLLPSEQGCQSTTDFREVFGGLTFMGGTACRLYSSLDYLPLILNGIELILEHPHLW